MNSHNFILYNVVSLWFVHWLCGNCRKGSSVTEERRVAGCKLKMCYQKAIINCNHATQPIIIINLVLHVLHLRSCRLSSPPSWRTLLCWLLLEGRNSQQTSQQQVERKRETHAKWWSRDEQEVIFVFFFRCCRLHMSSKCLCQSDWTVQCNGKRLRLFCTVRQNEKS